MRKYIPFLPAAKKPVVAYNPTRAAKRLNNDERPEYTVFDYNAIELSEFHPEVSETCADLVKKGQITWLNMAGLRKEDVAAICTHFGIHPLLQEDILSEGQRAKMDEQGNILFALVPMVFYDAIGGLVEVEQVSLILGKGFVLSFQEDAIRDRFDAVRQKLRTGHERLRASGADYLWYSLLDVIIDGYFDVLEQLAIRIELLEDKLVERHSVVSLRQISLLRKEVMLMRTYILPVREVVTAIMRNETGFIDKRTRKYYKDIQDHIIQATEIANNHRDMVMNLQDLFLNQSNMRLNEVIKVFTIITTLLAPATVIGGIFGMNFDVIPLSHKREGFYVSVALMFIIPIFMLMFFKKKKWF